MKMFKSSNYDIDLFTTPPPPQTPKFNRAKIKVYIGIKTQISQMVNVQKRGI